MRELRSEMEVGLRAGRKTTAASLGSEIGKTHPTIDR
jgi:hypothetical protein